MLIENEIYLGDCLDLMPQIESNSIDMVLCDLPYGVLNKSNPHAQWDNVIPLEKLWEQYERICKDKANIVLFGQGMFTAKMMTSKPDWWRYNLIWDKQCVTGWLDANRRPLPSHEDIMVFTKGGGYGYYNPQMVKVGWHIRNHNKRGGNHNLEQSCYGKLKDMPTVLSDEKFPRSIVSFLKATDGRNLHPTAKSVSLLRWLLMTYSKVGGVILDNTMGSGSTCVACIKEKRKYIGIELNKEYYDIAEKRINEEKMQLTLF